MDTFSKIKNACLNVGGKIVSVTERYSKISKDYIEIKQLEREIEEICRETGKTAISIVKEKSFLDNIDFVKASCDKISDIDEKISKLYDEIAQLKERTN